MNDKAHQELKQLFDFFVRQRERSPDAFTHGEGVIPAPSFFSVRLLQEYLNNPLLTPDWLTLYNGGEAVALDEAFYWKMIQRKKLSFIDKSFINSHLERGAAVVLEGVDIQNAAINAFATQIDEVLPCALANCVAFFSKKGNEAYQGHRDSDDVLVIQIAGEKRWHIFNPQRRRYLNNAPLTREQMGKQAADIVMKPGDALYVRAGVPHICETVSDYSLHLAFDLCDRTPTIEQITHEANLRYNNACEEAHAPAARMTKKYIELLQSAEFQRTLSAATRARKNEVTSFRKRMGRSADIDALSKYL